MEAVYNAFFKSGGKDKLRFRKFQAKNAAEFSIAAIVSLTRMNTGFLFRPRVRQALTIMLLLIAISTLLPARMPLMVWWVAQARWVALGYILLAMALLMFNRTRLMFVCLGCSAAICLYFNEIQGGAPPRAPDGKTAPAPVNNTPPGADPAFRYQ